MNLETKPNNFLKMEENKMLKKCLLSMGKLVALGSFLVAAFNANSACVFIYHQPELPDKVKRLRKF